MESLETGFLNRTVRTDDLTMSYQLYLPRSFTMDSKWPVILFLHGAGERGTDGLRQTQVGLGTTVRWNSSWFPSLVVFPQAPSGSNWSGPAGQAALAALDRSVKEFNGDANHLYAVGISMGGYGVVELAIQYPERFAAVVPVCGGLAIPRDAEPANIRPPFRHVHGRRTAAGPDPYLALSRSSRRRRPGDRVTPAVCRAAAGGGGRPLHRVPGSRAQLVGPGLWRARAVELVVQAGEREEAEEAEEAEKSGGSRGSRGSRDSGESRGRRENREAEVVEKAEAAEKTGKQR